MQEFYFTSGIQKNFLKHVIELRVLSHMYYKAGN